MFDYQLMQYALQNTEGLAPLDACEKHDIIWVREAWSRGWASWISHRLQSPAYSPAIISMNSENKHHVNCQEDSIILTRTGKQQATFEENAHSSDGGVGKGEHDSDE